MRTSRAALLIAAWLVAHTDADAQDLWLEDVPAVAGVPIAQIKPRTVIFADQGDARLADPSTGLIAFEEWARARPVQQRFLSLFPTFVEPTINEQAKLRLSIYLAEARFRLARPAAALICRGMPISRSSSVSIRRSSTGRSRRPTPFPIKMRAPHAAVRPIAAGARRRRRSAHSLAICSKEKSRWHSARQQAARGEQETHSGFRRLPERDQDGRRPDLAELPSLTGLDLKVTSALEQNIFWVNQVIQFGKLLGVLQQHPTEPNAAIATVYIVVAVRNDVLNKQKEYSKTPVLRNLVPAQLLMGNSSFNSGNSLSAGLPKYARSRIKAIADMLERE